jgi:hypothetical protein
LEASEAVADLASGLVSPSGFKDASAFNNKKHQIQNTVEITILITQINTTGYRFLVGGGYHTSLSADSQ